MNFNLILKYKHGIFRIISLIFCILLAESINAQSPISDSLNLNFKKNILGDSLDQKTAHSQSLDTLKSKTVDSIEAKKSDIETTILYSCRDSIRMNVAEQKVYLYGDAKVTYGSRVLTAEYMEINWALNEVTAYGLVDTTGKTIGRPIFREGADMYTAEVIRYNMKSGKGIIKGIVTKQGDGYIQGGPVKKTPEAIYVNNAFYTTCNLPHPHFSINASRLKVIPGDKVVTGPFHMKIMDIHTPLGLPLGFFPVTKRQKSGIIFPTIGEQRSRGFFISNGGYYWAVNDYLGIKMLGDLYANQSYRISTTANYIKRYSYTGMMSGNYSSTKENFDDATPFIKTMNFTWTHRQMSQRPSQFSANVNISSSKYYQSTSYNPTNLMSSSFTSNVSWTKVFRNSPFSLTIAARQSQNVQTKQMDVTAPDASLNMNRIYVFKKKGSDGNKWFEKINISYNGRGQYQFSNFIKSTSGDVDTLKKVEDILSKGQWNVTNSIPISTTFKLFKYFNLNPQLAGQVYFYDRTITQDYNATTKEFKSDTTKGFAAAYAYSFNTSLSTRVYGTYRLKSKIMPAIRHTLIPTATYSYRPDFSDPGYGFYNNYQDSLNHEHRTSKFLGAAPGGGGVQNMLSFNLTNTLEGKVRNRKDTTGTAPLKIVKLIETFSISGGYNFTADSCNWSPLRVNAATRLFNKISIAFNSTFDPYKYVTVRSVKTGEVTGYMKTQDQNPDFLTMRKYDFTIGTNLNPKAKGKGINAQPNTNVNPGNIPGISPAFGSQYVDFTIPWNLSFTYKLSYDKDIVLNPFNNSLGFNGDVKISDNWKIAFMSGYDFKLQGLSQSTSIQLYRDLHCWQMSMSILPFGTRQSFMFTIQAKSSLLRDLKITKQNPNYYGY